jgi:TPR repeat protein
MAANQNHALAQFNLGLMFASGQGVAQDEAKALMWMQKAAQQGDAGAQHHLGMRHRRASFEGPPKDKLESNLEAYKWFRLAAAQGYRASAGARDGHRHWFDARPSGRRQSSRRTPASPRAPLPEKA